jgi:hypothetical protein
LQNRLLAQVKSSRSINRFRILHGRLVNPGKEGRIKTILPTGIDLDPDARVPETILVATIDRGAGIWRSNDMVLPPLATDCRSEQQPAFLRGSSRSRDVSRESNVVL